MPDGGGSGSGSGGNATGARWGVGNSMDAMNTPEGKVATMMMGQDDVPVMVMNGTSMVMKAEVKAEAF